MKRIKNVKGFSRPAGMVLSKKGGGADHFMDRLTEWLRVNNLLD
jgi:hypothetical protein